MNSLRISQSCYAQLTSVYTNLIALLSFSWTICFVSPVNVWQERVNRWINGCHSRVGFICFIAHRTWMTWFSRWSIWCKSESIHSYNKKQSPYLFIAKYSEEYIVFPKSIVMQQLLLCSLAQAFCNMWWQHNNWTLSLRTVDYTICNFVVRM